MGNPVLILPRVSQFVRAADRKTDFESEGIESKYLHEAAPM